VTGTLLRRARPAEEVSDTSAPEVVPLRHPGQWVIAALALLMTVIVVRAFAGSENIDWGIVGEYLFSSTILIGVGVTVGLTILSMVIASLIGLAIAVMRLSDNRVLRTLSTLYLGFFRGVPLLVLLIFVYNLALVVPTLSLGIPFTGITFVDTSTNAAITPFIAAVIGLSFAEGAYMGEVVRAGILAVDPGQTEAGLSLGMRRGYLLRRITIPQAMRVIIPPTGNETLAMLKGTALVSVIAGRELLTRAQQVSAENYRVVELLIVATFWYLVLTAAFTLVQGVIERRYGRGFGRRDTAAKPIAPIKRRLLGFGR
jgi:polar amino acid transport system permease protein